MNCAHWVLCGVVLAAGLIANLPVYAQEAPPSPAPEAPAPPVEAPVQMPEQVQLNPAGPCVEPPPMVRMQDYIGPFHKVVGTFTQKLDRLSVQVPHYKPGVELCSLEIKDKFFLFLRDSVDPETLLAGAYDAGLSQAEDRDPTFGQGWAGYGKRLGAAYLDEFQYRFFKEFAYPTIFFEDPRYYRLGQGKKSRRFLHGVKHIIVAYDNNGRPMFNFSEWMGEISATSLSNLYHPGNRRGFGRAAGSIAADIGLDIGYDELREFWPELARKLRLPFRDQNEPQLVVPPPGI